MSGVGIGGHHKPVMGNDEWLTPPAIIDALGPFDLDPCSPVVRPWDTAKEHYDKADDGLSQNWNGRVWLNPPYGLVAKQWLRKLVRHGNGIALIFARTETDMFFKWVWLCAHAVLFIKGRLFFHYVSGNRAAHNSGAPSCLVAYGAENVSALERSGIAGHLVRIKE